MALSPEEKYRRRFERAMEQAKTLKLSTFRGNVASEFQLMVRAEVGAFVGHVRVVMDGRIQTVWIGLGEVACVTCGRTGPWKESKMHGAPGMDAGHFLSGRRPSILFEEVGVHPQCTYCNRNDGAPQAYRIYMLDVYGEEVVEYLEHLRDNVSRKFTRDELVTMLLEFRDRTKRAIKRMESGHGQDEKESGEEEGREASLLRRWRRELDGTSESGGAGRSDRGISGFEVRRGGSAEPDGDAEERTHPGSDEEAQDHGTVQARLSGDDLPSEVDDEGGLLSREGSEVGDGGVDMSLVADSLREVERQIYKVGAECLFKLGNLLVEGKRLQPHGEFEPWIKKKFGFTPRTAQRAMRVARNLVDEDGVCLFSDFALQHVQQTALHLLSAPTVPDDVLDECINQAGLGKDVTEEIVKDMLNPKATADVAFDSELSEDAEGDGESLASKLGEPDVSAAEAIVDAIEVEEEEEEEVPDVVNTLYELRLCLEAGCDASDIRSALDLIIAHKFGNVVVGYVLDEMPAFVHHQIIERAGDTDICPVCERGPEPIPINEKRKKPDTKAMVIRNGFKEFWSLVHRKVGKAKAEKAYQKAVERVKKELECAYPDAVEHINEAMQEFAESPQAHDEVTGLLHPTTWLNEGRYDDDRNEWNKGTVDGKEYDPEQVARDRERQERIDEIKRRRRGSEGAA